MGRKALTYTSERPCTKCKQMKPFSEFTSKPGKPLGISSRCRACLAEDAREKYWVDPEKGAARMAKRRAERPETVRQEYERYRTTILAKKQSDYQKRKNVWLARKAVSDAVRQGRLVRQPCEVCGAPESEGHHHKGYEPENWLEVQWLCSRHHADEHKRLRRDARRAKQVHE